MAFVDSIKERAKALLTDFKDQTNAFVTKNKDEEAIIFIKSTISTFETMLKAIDVFLKKKNIDVGKAVDTGKDAIHKASNVVKNVSKEAANSSLGKKLIDKGAQAASKVRSLFSKSDNKDTAPPDSDEKKDKADKPKGGLLSRGIGLLGSAASGILTKVVPSVASGIAKGTSKAARGLAKGAAKTAVEVVKPKSKKQRKAERKEKAEQATFDKAKERDAKNDKEVADEKKAVLDQAEKDKVKNEKGGWLSKILGVVTSLGGLLMGGLGTLGKFAVGGIGKAIKFGVGFLFKGLTTSLFKLAPMLSSGIAGTLQKLVGKGIGGAVSGAWSLAKTGVKAAIPFAGAALSSIGSGLATAATAIGPVGWAVLGVGAALYGGYRLYKYLNRGGVTDDATGKLTRLRLLMYGFNDTNKEYYSKIFDIEMLLKDFIEYKEGKLLMKPFDKEFKEKILEIFKVDPAEKAKFAILQTWFIKRMMPAYRAFMTALKGINPALYLDEIDKLKDGDIPILLSKLTIPSAIYDINQAPTFDTTSTDIIVNKQEVDNYISNILTAAKAKAGTVKPVTQVPVKPVTPPTPAVIKPVTESYSPAKDSSKAYIPLDQPNQNDKSQSKTNTVIDNPPQAEGEDKPKEEIKKDTLQTKVSGKLNVATGNLTPGTTSLEGITTKIPKEKIMNLDPNVRELLTGMAKEYNTLTGDTIPVNEAFRSFADQEALYKKYPGKAAKPGNSTHEAGLAIDIASVTADKLEKLGLLRKYGFTRPIGGEKWHLEPIGVSVNPALAKKDPNFRFAAIQSSIGKGGDGYGTLSNSKLKSRDTKYQLNIYNKASDTPIDVQKALAATKDTSLPMPSASATLSPTATVTAKVDKSEKSTTTDKSKSKVGVIESLGPKEEALVKPTATPIVKPEVNTNIETTPPVIATNTNTDVGKVADLNPEQAIEQAAKLTGVSKDTLMAFAKIESSLNGKAKAKTSSASGLFQITDSTWKELLAKHGAKYGIPSDAKQDNNYYNAVLAAEYAKGNLARLSDYKAAKLEDSTAMYLAHHFGVAGANKIIKQILSDPNKPMSETVSPDAYKANIQELKGKTAQTYAQAVSFKINKALNTTYPSQTNSSKNIDQAKTDNNVKLSPEIATKDTTAQGASLKAIRSDLPRFSTEATPIVNDRATRPFNAFSDTISKTLEDIKKPNPSINATSYNSMTSKVDKAASPVQTTPDFSTGKMEDILTNQLSNLTQIVTILTSIDGKINLDKLKEAMPSNNTQQPKQELVNMGIPKNSVNLTRRSLTT